MAHNGWGTISISSACGQLRDFLDRNPTEIVFVLAKRDWNARDRLCDSDARKHLEDGLTNAKLEFVSIEKTIQNDQCQTIEEILANKHRVVLAWDEVSSSWGSTSTQSVDELLENMRKWLNEREKRVGKWYMADLQTTMHGSCGGFCKHSWLCCKRKAYKRASREISDKVLDCECSSCGIKDLARANFIGMDFCQAAQGLVNALIDHNIKNSGQSTPTNDKPSQQRQVK